MFRDGTPFAADFWVTLCRTDLLDMECLMNPAIKLESPDVEVMLKGLAPGVYDRLVVFHKYPAGLFNPNKFGPRIQIVSSYHNLGGLPINVREGETVGINLRGMQC